HDVLAPTLPGHAGGPPLDGEVTDALIPDAIERAMDEAGFETAHIVGNSLGGYVALQLAARGRADSVVALAPPAAGPGEIGLAARRSTSRRRCMRGCRRPHRTPRRSSPQLGPAPRNAV